MTKEAIISTLFHTAELLVVLAIAILANKIFGDNKDIVLLVMSLVLGALAKFGRELGILKDYVNNK